jgi:hypothetical protein
MWRWGILKAGQGMGLGRIAVRIYCGVGTAITGGDRRPSLTGMDYLTR